MHRDRPIKIISRDEVVWAARKRPGFEVILGALSGLANEFLSSTARGEFYDWRAGGVAALAGAILFWTLRFLKNVWMAPRYVAADDRQDLERAYETLRAQYEDAQRQLGQQRHEDKRTHDLLVIGHFQAGSLLRQGTKGHLETQEALREWLQYVEDFMRWLAQLKARNLTDAERADISAALHTFPPMDSEIHIDAGHARVWGRVSAVYTVLNSLMHKYEAKRLPITQSVSRSATPPSSESAS